MLGILFDRDNRMFRALTSRAYVRRLIKTRAEDYSVVADEINKTLRVERLKRRFRQYFPRLSINVLVTRIVKPKKNRPRC